MIKEIKFVDIFQNIQKFYQGNIIRLGLIIIHVEIFLKQFL